jgi:putative endonuclease
MDKPGYVYILASRRNGTIYIGVTSDLPSRVYQHKIGAVKGFARKYGCKILVWYQAFDQLDAARRRPWKLRAIEETNPDWVDLYESLF